MPDQHRPLPAWRGGPIYATVWNEPYLESCCRAALHRLWLAGAEGRPDDVPDAACLRRLAAMGLCQPSPGRNRFLPTAAGDARHASEILKTIGDTTVRTAAR